MDPIPIAPENQGQSAASGDPLKGADVLENAQALWAELCQLSQDRFLLAALETRRAGEGLVDMVVAGVMVAILMTSAWLGLIAALVLGLIEHGFLASTAMLLAVAGNLLLALIFCGVILRKRHDLQFPATRRSFQAISTAHPEAKQP